MITLRSALLLPLIGVFLLFTGCASIPWMSLTDNPGEVSGTYQIRQFEFEPQASALETVNVLNYLNEGATTLELTKSKDFVLTYQTRDDEQVTLTGTYSVTPKKVELSGQEEDADFYRQVLLDREFYLLRKRGNVLWVDTKKNAALKELSSSYRGVTGAGGILRVKFTREKTQSISTR